LDNNKIDTSQNKVTNRLQDQSPQPIKRQNGYILGVWGEGTEALTCEIFFVG